MTDDKTSTPTYEVRVRGHVGERFARAFAPLVPCRACQGITVLRGPIADQAALHGLLRRLERFGVFLLSLTCLDEDKLRGA